MFICQHSSRNKKSNISVRNAGCNAKLDILIKNATCSAKKKDDFLLRSPPLLCIIKLGFSHTHETITASSLRLLRVDKDKRGKLFYIKVI